MEKATLLEVHNLRTYFTLRKGTVRAVDDISFSLAHGEALGLVGESGCGKTTSALSIANLLPPEGHIAGGRILLEGTDLARLSEREIRAHRWKDVSIVFQGAMNALNPVMRIGEQIVEVILLHQKLSRQQALERTAQLLDFVEIPPARLRDYPHEFSGGMKQRVMIAMALACSPKLIIGDEPTTALDVMVQAQILNLFEKLRRELNMGLIMITHDLAILSETCDRIAVMYAGKIVETGTVEDIFDRRAHPYTRKLIECFPVVGQEKVIPDGIPGVIPNMMAPPPGCAFHPRCEFAGPLCREAIPESMHLGGQHWAACHHIEGQTGGEG